MKILFTGAQGTGKTTVFEAIRDYSEFKDFAQITSVSRQLQQEENIDLSGGENTNGLVQNKIFDIYLQKFTENDNVIADRSLYDVLAYTKYCSGCCEEYWAQFHKIEEFNKKYGKDIIYFYFPIEFKCVPDGVRSVDEGFRKYISESIWHNIAESAFSLNGNGVCRVSGSVDARVEYIMNIIKKRMSCYY